MERLAVHSGWQGSTSLSIHVEMTWLVLLVYLPLLRTAEPQELEFVVLSTSVHKERAKPRLTDRNPYVHVGRTMRMLCRYSVSSEGRDYCAEKKSTRLTVHPVDDKERDLGDRLVVIDSSSKCNLTVEFRNVSADMEGQYACTDEVAKHSDRRSIRVGEAPVLPENVSVVYWPPRSIALNLDPVKTGLDLNTPGTTWTVKYAWEDKEYTKCHKKAKRCNSQSSGLCQACVIRLKNYSGCGHYTSMGIITGDIRFRIIVRNIFGNVTVTKMFNLPNWVRPNAVEGLNVPDKNQSSLLVAVDSPKGLDESHYTFMARGSYPMKLRLSVELVSARKQSLLLEESRDFYERHGFVRNLDDDQAALDPQLVATFQTKAEEFLWNLNPEKLSCKRRTPTQYLPVSGLPFPGYYYNVCIQTFARYPGEKACLEVNTQEAAPMEGPELHENFAYCDHSKINPEACGNCVIYFKEIPRSRRGSARVNYTMTARLLNGQSLQHQGERCTTNTTHFTEAQDQSNSVLILGLEIGGEYNISLQAHNAAGSSSVTSRILRVHRTPPPTTPRKIVLEKKYTASGQTELYELYWAPIQPGHPKGVQYFVHYCNATSLQFHEEAVLSVNRSSKPPEQNLNCVTNMVNKPVGEASSFSFEQKSYKALRVAFFVSSVTDDGFSSGLQKVGSFYTQNIWTEGVRSVTAQKVEHDIHALRVDFSLSYGKDLDYQYGRPYYYAVGMRKMKASDADVCKQRCSSLMQETNYERVPLLPTHSLNKPVKYERNDLEPGSMYCVGVNVAERSMMFTENTWKCTVGWTASQQSYGSDESKVGIIPVILGPLGILLLIVLCIVWFLFRQHIKKEKSKFKIRKSDLQVPLFESFPVQLESDKIPKPVCNGNVFSGHPTIPISPGSGSSVVIRDGTDRYPLACPSGVHYPSVLPFTARDGDASNGIADSEEASESRSEGDGEEEEEESGDPSDGGSSCAQEPLIDGPSQHCKPQEQSRQTVRPVSSASVECRPLLFDNHGGREYERDLSLSVEAGGAREHATALNHIGSSDHIQDCNFLSTAPIVSPCLTDPQGPSLLDHQPVTTSFRGNRDKPPLLFAAQRCLSSIPAEQCPEARFQAQAHGICDTHQTNTIGQYSIDDILQAAESLPSTTTPDVGAAGGSETTAEQEPLLLENILRAADMCPWKGGADICDGVAVQGAAGMSDHGSHGSQRDSACDSSIDTESIKETEAESKSLTGNS